MQMRGVRRLNGAAQHLSYPGCPHDPLDPPRLGARSAFPGRPSCVLPAPGSSISTGWDPAPRAPGVPPRDGAAALRPPTVRPRRPLPVPPDGSLPSHRPHPRVPRGGGPAVPHRCRRLGGICKYGADVRRLRPREQK